MRNWQRGIIALGALTSALFTQAAIAAAPRINEFVASNSGSLDDEDGEASDWIEIYNPGPDPVNLDQWGLSDNANSLTKWRFPAVTLAPNQYLIVFASDKNRRVPGLPLHTNFKLSADGEYLGLTKADGVTIVDQYAPAFPEQFTDISYGHGINGVGYMIPTPGAANGSAFEGFVDPVSASVARGFYDAPVQVTLSCPTPSTTIRYTLDGSDPSESSPAYSAPIDISTTTVLRAAAFRPNWRPSSPATHTYLMNQSAAMKSLPVWSIGADPQQSWGAPNGVVAIVGGDWDEDGHWYPVNPGDYNNCLLDDLERISSAELIHSADNSGFQINSGLRVHGSPATRLSYHPDSVFNLRQDFEPEYGGDRLEYPLYPGVERVDSLVFRGGVGNPRKVLADEFFRRLHQDMGRLASHGALINLFVNGARLGLYTVIERHNEEFFQESYGSDENWDVLTQGSIPNVRDGDLVRFNAMMSYVATHDLTQPANYAGLSEYLDLPAFVDYLILQLYSANWDWPHNNWTAARERSNGPLSVFRFYIWDIEEGANPTLLNRVYLRELNEEPVQIPQIYRALKHSPEFLALFQQRMRTHFYNGGPLTRVNASARYTELRNAALPSAPGITNWVVDTFVPQRRDILFNAFAEEGLYDDAPAVHVNGVLQNAGFVSPGATLTLTDPLGAGEIYYTLDGSDPSDPATDEPAAGALSYSATGPFTLTPTARLNARVRLGADWSRGRNVQYIVEPISLHVNEIGAENLGALEDPDEPGEFPAWFELYNATRANVDLSGCYLTNDSLNPTLWEIPAGVVIAPEGFVVFLADNEPQQGPLHAGFTLDAMGGAVFLFDRDGKTLLHTMTYEAGPPDITIGLSPDGSDCPQALGAPTPGGANDTSCFRETEPVHATFDVDEEGFGYLDDAFRATNNPAAADGAFAPAGGEHGGGLQVNVAGLAVEASGGWTREITIPASALVSGLEFTYRLELGAGFAAGDYVDVLVAVDGVLQGISGDYVQRVEGADLGGAAYDSGWIEAGVDVPGGPGKHVITLGLYVHSSSSASARLSLDHVHVEAEFLGQAGVACECIICTGDINGDMTVDLADLAILLSQYGQYGVLEGDIDGDHTVALVDLALLLSGYGGECP